MLEAARITVISIGDILEYRYFSLDNAGQLRLNGGHIGDSTKILIVKTKLCIRLLLEVPVKRIGWAVLVTWLVLVPGLAPAAFAQNVTGSVRGSVTDEQGGSVAGAQVEVTNADASFESNGHDGIRWRLQFPGPAPRLVQAPRLAPRF